MRLHHADRGRGKCRATRRLARVLAAARFIVPPDDDHATVCGDAMISDEI